MKTFIILWLALTCSVSSAQTGTIYHPLEGVARHAKNVLGTDASSRAHPGDSSHAPAVSDYAPTVSDLVLARHRDIETTDANGQAILWRWVPGTNHTYIHSAPHGLPYAQAARQRMPRHWTVGSPPPPEAFALHFHHFDPHSFPPHFVSAHHPFHAASQPHPINPYTLIAGLVALLVGSVVLGAGITRLSDRRSRALSDNK